MRRILVAFAIISALAGATASVADESKLDPLFPNLPLYAPDGSEQIDLESFKGNPILLTFWASYCGPCREELPALEKIYAELGDEGFVLLTVNMDRTPAQGFRFLERYNIDVPVYVMDGKTLSRLGVKALPTSILLDADMRPARIYQGYHPTLPDEIRRLVLKILDGASMANGELG
jgi:thiol-disulfide isomerase/thioredoxin